MDQTHPEPRLHDVFDSPSHLPSSLSHSPHLNPPLTTHLLVDQQTHNSYFKMTDDTPRHWKGEPGNRHEHVNPIDGGGAKSPITRAAWALTPEMVRNLGNRRVCPIPVPLSCRI